MTRNSSAVTLTLAQAVSERGLLCLAMRANSLKSTDFGEGHRRDPAQPKSNNPKGRAQSPPCKGWAVMKNEVGEADNTTRVRDASCENTENSRSVQ